MVIELAIFKDKKEKELQSLNNELEEKVKKRTADLNEANKELQKALEKERELSELKSRIVQNVSHGFKTPLTSILSSAQLLKLYAEKEHPFKAKLVKHANKIENSVRNLNSLLTSVLFFGKADADKMNYKPVRIYTSAFLNEVVDMVKAGIDNNVKINVEFEKIPKMITSDMDLLYQILENLLSNAVKYSKDGGSVYFKVKHENDTLFLNIKDEGIGINEAEQSQLFDRFFRAKNVGLREGSGLGLSIVKKCIEVMGGKIDFKSKLNKGTEFNLEIPAKK
jgi:signal transduction histidine kinase